MTLPVRIFNTHSSTNSFTNPHHQTIMYYRPPTVIPSVPCVTPMVTPAVVATPMITPVVAAPMMATPVVSPVVTPVVATPMIAPMAPAYAAPCAPFGGVRYF
ncbi:Protein CBG05199 [Caenorhabditis briggsae]|uniref:Uncharacterized protein n=2 Tax=Caenorhabditis briggsae TaxID=6238 RepID=A0AAE9DAR6_CAEBR|nr:Protein CBG05199 [Caenorhabditis briggsae]ULT99727.1 hypothetical protein L3Y34_000781 [Caenorhabditis briggsae]CAP25742.2 Protein CBG05199 [Caenorhabditis briggsae]